jgi:hypothetical protein
MIATGVAAVHHSSLKPGAFGLEPKEVNDD